MAKFKIGDRVRVVNPREASLSDNGKEFTIKTDEGLWGGEQSWHGPGVSYRHKEGALELIEPTSQGPVRTKTVKEVVPGEYGEVTVGNAMLSKAYVKIADAYGRAVSLNATELRAAAATLLEIAEALDA